MRCSDLWLPGNGKRLCLLALHYCCLITAAACAIAAATRPSQAWLRLACTAGGGASLMASGGPGGLDYAYAASQGNGSSEGFGLALVPALNQLAIDSRAWSSISWLLAGASVAIVASLMALLLKKFCGRARALTMTDVVAFLVCIGSGALTAAIIVYLIAAARLRAVFDTVTVSSITAGGSNGSVSVSSGGGDGGASGFALTVAADLACLGDLLLLAAKRLAFARDREASSYNVEAAAAAVTVGTNSKTDSSARTDAAVEPRMTATVTTRSSTPPPPPRAHRLMSLAPIADGVNSSRSSEHLRHRLERRQETERRAVPHTSAKTSQSQTVVEVSAGGGAFDNLVMEPISEARPTSSIMESGVDFTANADEEPIVSVDAL